MSKMKKQTFDSKFVSVINVITNYFEGLYNSDTAVLADVFHPQAHYVCATDGDFIYRTMGEYFPIVDKRPSPASRRERRNDRILSLEFAGPVTAFAKVECSIDTKFFTDFLALVLVDGKWQIISKVFHYDIIERP